MEIVFPRDLQFLRAQRTEYKVRSSWVCTEDSCPPDIEAAEVSSTKLVVPNSSQRPDLGADRGPLRSKPWRFLSSSFVVPRTASSTNPNSRTSPHAPLPARSLKPAAPQFSTPSTRGCHVFHLLAQTPSPCCLLPRPASGAACLPANASPVVRSLSLALSKKLERSSRKALLLLLGRPSLSDTAFLIQSCNQIREEPHGLPHQSRRRLCVVLQTFFCPHAACPGHLDVHS